MIPLPSVSASASESDLWQCLKDFKRGVAAAWCDLSLDQLSHSEHQILHCLHDLQKEQPLSIPNAVKIVIASMVVVRYYPVSRFSVAALLDSVPVFVNDPVARFILKCYARQCRDRAPPWNTFLDRWLGDLAKSDSDPKFGVWFVSCLLTSAAKHMPIHAQDIFALLKRGVVGDVDLGLLIPTLRRFLSCCVNFDCASDFATVLRGANSGNSICDRNCKSASSQFGPIFQFTGLSEGRGSHLESGC
jgi:hypothetical protein